MRSTHTLKVLILFMVVQPSIASAFETRPIDGGLNYIIGPDDWAGITSEPMSHYGSVFNVSPHATAHTFLYNGSPIRNTPTRTYAEWSPGAELRGKRLWGQLWHDGRPGCLTFGPYIDFIPKGAPGTIKATFGNLHIISDIEKLKIGGSRHLGPVWWKPDWSSFPTHTTEYDVFAFYIHKTPPSVQGPVVVDISADRGTRVLSQDLVYPPLPFSSTDDRSPVVTFESSEPQNEIEARICNIPVGAAVFLERIELQFEFNRPRS